MKPLTEEQNKLRLKLTRYLRAHGLNVHGFSNQIIEKLVRSGMLTQTQDIYALRPEDLATLKSVGIIKGRELHLNLHVAKFTTLPRFLNGIGVPGLGITKAQVLVERFKTIGKIMNVEGDDLRLIKCIGGDVIESMVNYFNDDENIDLIWDLRQHGVTWPTHRVSDSDAWGQQTPHAAVCR